MAADVVDKYLLSILCGKCGEFNMADKWEFDCVPTGTWVKWCTIQCPDCKTSHLIQGNLQDAISDRGKGDISTPQNEIDRLREINKKLIEKINS